MFRSVPEDGEIAASTDSNSPVVDQGQTTEIGELVLGNDHGGDKSKPKKKKMSLDEAVDDSENLTDFLLDFDDDE